MYKYIIYKCINCENYDYSAMQQIRNKRGFVISKSSFPGHGRYAGVWTGDISSTWDDMAHSVSGEPLKVRLYS